MVTLSKVLPAFTVQERITAGQLADAVCLERSKMNDFIGKGKSFTNLDKLRFLWIGYDTEDLISKDKLSESNLRVLLHIVKNRVTDNAARILLDVNKTELNAISSGKLSLNEVQANDFIKKVDDAVCADETLMETVMGKLDLYHFRGLVNDIQRGRMPACIDESYISAYKEINALNEVEELKKRIAELEKENLILNNRLQGRSNSYGGGAIEGGAEEELYPSEVRLTVLDILVDYRNQHQERTRRVDIINDLLRANNYDEKELKKVIADFEEDLSDFYDKPAQPISSLGSIPVTHFHQRKHIKLIPLDDGRYTISAGATPSDYRAKENLLSIARGIIF